MMVSATLPVLVTPARDVPGQWIAHCLSLDLVTQGESLQHAFMMAHEAILQVVNDDIRQGLDPLDRAEAPTECWDVLNSTLRHGRPLMGVDDVSQIKSAVGYVQVSVNADALPNRPRLSEVEMLPPAWQIAAVRGERDSHPSCH